MLKNVFPLIALIVIAALAVWYLAFPAVVVLSFVPQIKTPPINFITKAPRVLEVNPTLDLYGTQGRAKANLILFHAANEKGKDDPRLQNLATILARSGFNVYVPTLSNLNREKFHPQVLNEMRDIILLVKNQKPKKPIILFSFSIGVGPELIVAAQDDIKKNLKQIVAFGGYYDLKNVAAFHTTGQGQDPFGLWLFARYYAQFLPPKDGQIFYQIADQKWQDPQSDISDLAKDLGEDGRKALALLENKDPNKVNKLIEELPSALKNFFAVFDPAPALKNLEAPILLLHSRHDPVIPFEESEKLLAALQKLDKKAQLVELEVFDHVNPVLPDLTFRNFFSLYLPEFWQLYRAVWKIIY